MKEGNYEEIYGWGLTDTAFSLCREHAEELGHAVPKEPLLFMKPPTAYITEGQSIMVNALWANAVCNPSNLFKWH